MSALRTRSAGRACYGKAFTVINEGLNGRTTVFDDLIEEYRCGKEHIIPLLDTAAPIELLIIMPGTNDLKYRFSASAYDIAEGAGLLIDKALSRPGAFIGGKPKILLVSPPHLAKSESCTHFDPAFLNSRTKSLELAPFYSEAAKARGAYFFDADTVVNVSVDGVHIDAAGHKIPGQQLACIVKKILA